MNPANNEITFRARRVCHDGILFANQLLRVSSSTGLITHSSLEHASSSDEILHMTEGADDKHQTIDLTEVDILAPGLLELQTNGLCGVHFTTLTGDNYEAQLRWVAVEMARNGVSGWYATIPTVGEQEWKKVSAADLNMIAYCSDTKIHRLAHTELFVSRSYHYSSLGHSKRPTAHHCSVPMLKDLISILRRKEHTMTSTSRLLLYMTSVNYMARTTSER